ncbi:carbohydrate ABC transporter permease, partial [Burkholderia multivorans]
MSATPTVIPGSSAPTRPLSLDVNRTKAGTRRRRRRGFGLTLLLAACSLTVLVPLYVTVSMA